MISGRWTRAFFWVGALALNACMTPQLQVYQPTGASALPQRVAVLPFTLEPSLEAAEHPERIFRQVFFNYFSYLGYQDLPPREVDARLQRAGLLPPERLIQADAASLRRALGVDAVIFGRVLDANNLTAGIYAETRLEAELRMLDLRSGRTLWKLDHHEIELSGIAQSTVVSMVQDQIDNSETRYAYYRAAELFSVKAMEQIPDPGRIARRPLRPPVIQSIRANVRPGQVLRPGDEILVEIRGPAGLQASFDIGNARTRLPMREIKPGWYRGRYRIGEQDRLDQALIIGRLVDRNGLVSKKIFRTLVQFEQV